MEQYTAQATGSFVFVLTVGTDHEEKAIEALKNALEAAIKQLPEGFVISTDDLQLA